ncbi:MAG: hypothetical protein JWM68_4919 [Verrucomicrobiales bacterium]|nr:hypothetical protein [Verrucomicrobiales bacterium]
MAVLTLTALTQSIHAQVIVESRVPGGGVSAYPPYLELGSWSSSTLKSTAPGVTAGVGSRFATNGLPAFTVKPTLVADKIYAVEATIGSASSIPTNLLATVSVAGGSGLPLLTDVFARANSNAWGYVGTLTLDPGVTEPEVTFTYATNQPAPNSTTRRFVADAVRFTEVIPAPPQIASEPANRTNLIGTIATFSVSATGPSPLTYRWRKGGVALNNAGTISGVTSNLLRITSVSLTNAGSYDVVVSNRYGITVSATATLTVAIASPVITNQPQSQTIIGGQTAQLSVGVTGTSPLSFQWSKDGINLTNNGRIFGATNSSLAISNSVLSDAGNYSVVVSNSAGTTNSDVAVLSVTTASPSITAQPQSQAVTSGQNASFSVSVAGTPPFAYQWTFDGTNISGATGSTLTVNAQASNQGNYVVIVNNSVGSVTSAPAILTVNPVGSTVIVESMFFPSPLSLPVVNGYPPYREVSGSWVTFGFKSAAPGVTPSVGSRFGTNNSAFAVKPTLLPGASYSVAVTHGASSFIPTNLVASITIAGGTGLPSMTTAFAASSSNIWMEIGTLTVDEGVSEPEVTFAYATNQPASGTNRRLCADAVRFVLSTNPPSIVTEPVGQTNLVGTTASLSVTATGTGPLIYSWRKDGVPLVNTGNITGASTAMLTISNILSSDEGTYDVVVTNKFGLATSSPALLVVTYPVAPSITAQPQNKTVAVGGTASFSVTASGTPPLSYQWRKDGTVLTNGGGIIGSTTAFLQITNASSSHSGNYDVIVSNSVGTITSDIAALTVNLPPVITIPPDSQVVLEGQDASFFVSVSGTAPFNYQWSKNGVNIPAATNDTLTILNVQPNDQQHYRVRISNGVGTVFSAYETLNISVPDAVVIESTQPNGNITPAPEYQEFGSWLITAQKSSAPGLSGISSRFLLSGTNAAFSIVPTLPTPGGTYAVEITHGWGPNVPNTNLLADVGVVGGSGLPEVTTAFVAWSSNVWSRVGILTLDTGVTQPEIRFSYSSNQPPPGFGRQFYADGVRFIEIPTLPVIAASPVDQSIVLGGEATFTVSATGTASLSYQWRKDGIDLPGATNSTLSLTGVQTSDAGIYTAAVGNMVATVVSPGATLIVNIPAAITAPPINQEVIQGQDATFVVTAIGDVPLNYQWQFNNIDITGATTSALSLNNVIAADAGSYTVIVTNAYGSASATASLVVDIPPAIVVQPVNATVTAGQSFSFFVIATGTQPLQFQWQYNGTAIAGATDATLDGNSDNFNGGSYRVLVSNVAGSVSSDSAKLIKPIPAGLYNGLFYVDGEVRNESSGFLRMNLVTSGSFTGKVSVAGSDYPFTGIFSDVHQATVSITRAKTTPLTLSLRLLTTNQSGEAVGTISDGIWNAAVQADRAFYSTNNPAPQAGVYTVAFVGNSSGLTSPGGSGLGFVTVGMDGSVNLHGGLLSDATTISQRVPLSREGYWPVYVSLYGGRGSLLGWITFANTTNSSFAGNLSWIKGSGVGNNYLAGFTNELTTVGSTFIYPPATPGILDASNVTMTLSGSSLNAGLDFFGMIPAVPNNKIESSNGANQLKLKIKENGSISGTLLWGPTRKLLPIEGILLQQSGEARGFFTAPDKTTGSFWLHAP